MMKQQTKQGHYLSNVVRIATTINPRTEADLAEKWAKILAANDGNQSQAIKNMIKKAAIRRPFTRERRKAPT